MQVISNTYLYIFSDECNNHWNHKSDNREDESINGPMKRFTISTQQHEQCLEIVPQSDGNDWEAGTQREDGKQSEKVLNEQNVCDGLIGRDSRTKVECVQVLNVAERVDGCKTQDEVETHNECIVGC